MGSHFVRIRGVAPAAAAIGAVVVGLAACNAILGIDEPYRRMDGGLDAGSGDARRPPEPPDSPPPEDRDAGLPVDDCVRAEGGVCGLVPQCGCKNGQTCDAKDLSGKVECVVAGTGGIGSLCAGTSACQLGLTCALGACRPYCALSATTCARTDGGACTVLRNGETSAPVFAVCRVACDPRDPLACGAPTAAGANGCAPDDDGGTDCSKAGSLSIDEPCSKLPDCKPGLVCVRLASGDACKSWCRVAVDGDCEVGTCRALASKVFVGGAEYGVCL